MQGVLETNDIKPKYNHVANSAAFLLSSAAKWITGVEFIIDGGYSAS